MSGRGEFKYIQTFQFEFTLDELSNLPGAEGVLTALAAELPGEVELVDVVQVKVSSERARQMVLLLTRVSVPVVV